MTLQENETSRLPGLFLNLAVFFLFLAFATAFFWPTLAGKESFFSTFDNSSQTYPWIHFVIHHLKSLQVPLWDASTYSGISFTGEIQTGAFYPGYWILAALVPLEPQGTIPIGALEFFVIAHYALAGWFMSLFLRENDLGWIPSILGGILFAFVGSTALRANGQINMFVGLCWLPLVLLFTQRALLDTRKPWGSPWILGAGLVLAMPVLGGHMTPTLLDVVALTVFVVLRSATSDAKISPLRSILVLGFIGIASLLFAAPQLSTGIEYLRHAYRWVGAPETVRGLDTVPYDVYGSLAVLKPEELWSLIKPSLSIVTKDGGTLFITFSGLVLALLGVFTRKRLAFFALFLAVYSVLVSLGDHGFMGPIAWHTPILNKVRQPVRVLYLYDFAMSVLAALGLSFFLDLLKGRQRLALGIGFGVLLAASVETYLHREQLDSTADVAAYAPRFYGGPLIQEIQGLSTENRLLHRVHIDGGSLPANMGNVFPIHGSVGHRATMPIPYFEFLGRDWALGGTVLDRLGVKWIATKEEQPGMRLIAEDRGVKLYERPHSLSVFHWEDQEQQRHPARIRHVEWAQGEVTIELAPHPGGTLVFAQVPYPGWNVEVDGKGRSLRDTHDLNAVELKAGENEVRFYYFPWSFWGTLPLPIAAILFWIYLVVRHSSEREARKRSKTDDRKHSDRAQG